MSETQSTPRHADGSHYPPVYIINVPKDKERWQYMQEQVERLRIPYERIVGEDGSSIDPSVSQGNGGAQLGHSPVTRLFSRVDSLAPGEYGCAVSHAKIYQEIVEHKTPHSVILEDDVTLSDDFGKVIVRAAQLMTHYDIVFLGNNILSPLSCWRRQKLMPSYTFGEFIFTPYGSHAYVVSLHGARRLLDQFQPITMPIDGLINGSNPDCVLRVGGISPYVAYHNRQRFGTTITGRRQILADTNVPSSIRLMKNLFMKLLTSILQCLPPFCLRVLRRICRRYEGSVKIRYKLWP